MTARSATNGWADVLAEGSAFSYYPGGPGAVSRVGIEIDWERICARGLTRPVSHRRRALSNRVQRGFRRPGVFQTPLSTLRPRETPDDDFCEKHPNFRSLHVDPEYRDHERPGQTPVLVAAVPISSQQLYLRRNCEFVAVSTFSIRGATGALTKVAMPRVVSAHFHARRSIGDLSHCDSK